jgi:predicted deacetylase
MSAPERGRAFCAVLHDVAPRTWNAYAPFVALADRLRVPLTLLVVPDFHHHGDLRRHPDFVAALDDRLARGDEIALHGYFHADDEPLRGTPIDYLMRRVYTHEAEFYRLDGPSARARLRQGLDLFAGFGWHPQGFVAPAWLLNADTRSALADLPLRYTSTVRELIDLHSGARHRAPALTWSARSAWRRGLSQLFNATQLRRHADAALLRLGLHPVDMQHDSARRFWTETVRHLLTCRTAVTKSAWLGDAA